MDSDVLFISIEKDAIKNIPVSVITSKSLGEFIKIKQNDIRKHRKSVNFYNDLKGPKWPAGRVFTSQEGTTFLIPTNLPQIAYLDLPQTAISCNKYYHDIIDMPHVSVDQRVRDNPFTDSGFRDYELQDLVLCGAIISLYLDDLNDIMLEEYKDKEILSLLKQWDVKRFSKFLDFYTRTPQTWDSYYTCGTLTSIMEYNSKDSKLIAESFRKMCTYFFARNFASLLPYYFIYFMMKHLKLSSGNGRSFGEHDSWLACENLVERKLVRGEVRSLKILLSFKCPSIFHPDYCQEDVERIRFWPRKRDGGEVFNSLHFYCHMTCLVLTFLEMSQAKKEDLQECIRLLWRAIPTPFIPLKDMYEFFRRMRLSFGWEDSAHLIALLPQEFDVVHQPRSLLDLARFSVLENCRTPEGIPSLGLPQKLHWFLMLNSMESYVINKNSLPKNNVQ